jgi:hypothetical protein
MAESGLTQRDEAEHEHISAALDLERIDTNLYRSKSLWVPVRARGVFGGQVISQAVVAATKSVDSKYALHVSPSTCFWGFPSLFAHGLATESHYMSVPTGSAEVSHCLLRHLYSATFFLVHLQPFLSSTMWSVYVKAVLTLPALSKLFKTVRLSSFFCALSNARSPGSLVINGKCLQTFHRQMNASWRKSASYGQRTSQDNTRSTNPFCWRSLLLVSISLHS